MYLQFVESARVNQIFSKMMAACFFVEAFCDINLIFATQMQRKLFLSM